MFRKKKAHIRAGFTLLEMSISVLVISLVIAGVVAIENQKIRVEQRAEIARKLELIAGALYNYRLANNALPCPGNSSLPLTDSNFGLQADAVGGNCGLGATISSNLNTNDAGNSVFGGSVPVRTLGLEDDVAFDPWGNQFTYYVDKNARAANAFANGTDLLTDTNLLNVQDESGTTLSDDILAVVISHGANGHGGFNSSGSRVDASSTNAAELINCMCTSAALADPDTSMTVRIQRTMPTSSTDFTTNFDDIGRYFNKTYFYTYSELHPY